MAASHVPLKSISPPVGGIAHRLVEEREIDIQRRRDEQPRFVGNEQSGGPDVDVLEFHDRHPHEHVHDQDDDGTEPERGLADEREP